LRQLGQQYVDSAPANGTVIAIHKGVV